VDGSDESPATDAGGPAAEPSSVADGTGAPAAGDEPGFWS
jgi:hypothetical protein